MDEPERKSQDRMKIETAPMKFRDEYLLLLHHAEGEGGSGGEGWERRPFVLQSFASISVMPGQGLASRSSVGLCILSRPNQGPAKFGFTIIESYTAELGVSPFPRSTSVFSVHPC